MFRERTSSLASTARLKHTFIFEDTLSAQKSCLAFWGRGSVSPLLHSREKLHWCRGRVRQEDRMSLKRSWGEGSRVQEDGAWLIAD